MTDTAHPPFFILGCVRSGTTMLRDLLRSVPGLCCPEETHFYRWAHPYGTGQFEHNYRKNAVLARHREIDAVTEEEMGALLETARTRREFTDQYMTLFREKQGLDPDTRWFDKTPQNIYCIDLLAADYPDSRFVHITRDPRNVVASLAVGKVMKVDNLVGAANYWRESEILAAAFERANPDRMLTVTYADLTGDPVTVVRRICRFVDIEPVPPEELGKVRHERNAYAEVLDPAALDLVEEICGPVAREPRVQLLLMRVLILGEAKSGTTMLHRAICDALGTPPEQSFFEPEDLGELDLTAADLVAKKLMGNLMPSEKDLFLEFDRRVLLVRDPRDRFISWLLYDIHGHVNDLDPDKVEGFISLLRKKEKSPSDVSFLRLTHAYWRLTGTDLLGSLARSTARMNDILGRFRDLFEVVQYELYVAGESSRLEIYLGVDELGLPDVGPDLQRVVRTKSSGDWRHWFTERDLLWLRPMVSGVLRRQGYPRNWDLAEHQEIDPEHCSWYVERLVAEARA